MVPAWTVIAWVEATPTAGAKIDVVNIQRNWRKLSKATVRMEDTPPGEVAEADFGRLGMIIDPETGRRRVVWAMVIVLCHSRHCFVWPMHLQKLEDVISGLETAWAFFGGMPKYLVIDN